MDQTVVDVPTGLTAQRVLTDVRLLALAVVAGISVVDATWGLRTGAVVAVVVLLTSLATVRLTAADWFATALVALAWASLWWTLDAEVTWLTALNFLALLGLFVAVRTVVRTAKAMHTVVLGVLAGCVYAVVQILLADSSRFRVQFDDAAVRETLTGINANYLAYSFTTAGVLIVLTWVCNPPSGGRKLWMLAVAAVMWVGVVQSGTRGAAIGVGALVAWLLWQRWRPGRGLGFLWCLAVGVNVLIVSGWADQLVRSRLTVTLRDTGDLNGRLTIWPVARTEFFDHPFVGQGAGVFRTINPYQIAAHNVFLELGVGLGILGLLLFVGLVYSALVVDTRGAQRHTLLVGAFVAAITPILSSGHWIESPVFWISLALFSRLALFSPVSEDLVVADAVGGLVGSRDA